MLHFRNITFILKKKWNWKRAVLWLVQSGFIPAVLSAADQKTAASKRISNVSERIPACDFHSTFFILFFVNITFQRSFYRHLNIEPDAAPLSSEKHLKACVSMIVSDEQRLNHRLIVPPGAPAARLSGRLPNFTDSIEPAANSTVITYLHWKLQIHYYFSFQFWVQQFRATHTFSFTHFRAEQLSRAQLWAQL